MRSEYRAKRIRKKGSGQAGFGLVETLMAIAIMGTSVAAFSVGLSAGSLAVTGQDRTATAQGLAQTQMEYTKSYAYHPGAAPYPAVAAPPGYGISVGVSAVPGTDANIQKITVTVTREGQTVETLEGYKLDR